MKHNIGNFDRLLRIILGLVIGGLGIYFKSWFGLLGLIPILTALTHRCPAYLPMGISTCRTKQH